MGMYLMDVCLMGCVPHGMCASWDVCLMGVCLMGVYLMGMYLMGVYLMGVRLMGYVSHGACAS
jgi:hypothetical protein